MAVTDYSMTLAGGLLKTFYTGPIRDQLNNDTVLKKMISRNTADIQGGAAVIGLHTGRNKSVAARSPGVALPVAGQQSHTQATTALKYVYGRGRLTGPDINKCKGNKGAFARLLDTEVQGLMRDMAQDVNRQLFSDGSGFIAFNSTENETTPLVLFPYLWNPPSRYMNNVAYFQATLKADHTNIEANDTTLVGTLIPGAITDTGNVSSMAFTGTMTSCTSLGAGIGKFGTIQTGASNAITRRELMGLWGIVHDTNLIGDQNFAYDRGNSVTDWTGPEGQAYDHTIASMVNTLQGIDANANSFWRADCRGNGGVPRALSLSLMYDLWGALKVNQSSNINLLMTTYKVQNKYAELVAQDRRFTNTMKLDGGFTGLEFNGVPLVADADCPRGTIFFVDTSTLELYVGEDYNWIEDGGGSPLHYISGFDAFDMVLRYYAELGTTRRNANGKIYDILEV